MKPKSAKSLELYDIMMKRGYPEEFCDQISKNLNTDWTAQRMIGYLSHYKKLPMEEIVDELLANCYFYSMKLAMDNGIRSIAFGSLICMIMAVYSGHKMISGNKRRRKQMKLKEVEE